MLNMDLNQSSSSQFFDKDENIYLLMFILDPLLLIGIIILFWSKPLKEILIHRTREFYYYYIFYGSIPVFFATLFFIYLAYFENPTLSYELKNIRIQVPLKTVDLIDHRGEIINFNKFKGKVLIITSFYSHCEAMCPLILRQVRDISNQIKDKSQIKIFAITMDPERDTPQQLDITAKSYKMDEPYYHFLTGDKDLINQYLDQLNFARKYNPKTGEYSHANIILIVDKNNKLAYRFTINEQQKKLAIDAIKYLLNE